MKNLLLLFILLSYPYYNTAGQDNRKGVCHQIGSHYTEWHGCNKSAACNPDSLDISKKAECTDAAIAANAVLGCRTNRMRNRRTVRSDLSADKGKLYGLNASGRRHDLA